MVIDDNFLYTLEKAADRLQQQATSCRGTVQDDYKAYGLQREADAVREAVNKFVALRGMRL